MSDTASQAHPIPMPSEAPVRPLAEPRLRLWPGIVIVVVQWLVILIPSWVVPGTMTQFIALFWGPILGTLGIAIWWLFFSRLRWKDRLLGVLVCTAAGVAAAVLCHPSFQFGLALYGLRMVMTSWVVWLFLSTSLGWPAQRVGLLLVLLAAWGYNTLLRFDGVDGDFSAELSWRWSPTAEDRFLAERTGAKASDGSIEEPLKLQPGDWPGFRGPDRDSRLTGVRIATDWKEHPPRPLWRHRVGPGWSSFAVVGKRIWTQEQRGENEAVVCYSADTGEELWAHEDRARFTETVSGAGPRATPTFHDGKICALGGNGRLNCLDAATGKIVWSRDIVEQDGAKVPTWGFASSPLVLDGIVTVFGGPEDKGVLAFHAATGSPAWSAGDNTHSYCSTHRAKLDGVEQVLVNTGAGLTAFQPASGEVLWRYEAVLPEGMARVVQPTVLNKSDVLIGSGFGTGTHRVRVSKENGGWKVNEVWTTKGLSPYFNDMVAHKDHLYGFDTGFLTCVSLEDGERRWRMRGYGNGELLLLADQDLLLVMSEKGEAALVRTDPKAHQLVAKFQALESKTWNHPVIAHGKLFVRNGEEAVCYRLTEEAPRGKE